jgi:hypothetical protein
MLSNSSRRYPVVRYSDEQNLIKEGFGQAECAIVGMIYMVNITRLF